MRNLNLLPVSDAVKSDIRLMRDKLAAYAGIHVDILEFTAEGIVRLRVEQKELRNGYILNQAELVGRAAAVLSPLENAFRIHYVALTYNPDLNEIDASWINSRMEEFKLSRKDLLKQMGLDASTLSVLLSGEKNLTRFQKAAFYYYFLCYEINRDVRDYLKE
jgi:antitoxin component HigA of HigAB toxin-antitoxin module